jgi:ABC-type Zn uptake system ZnuABC Zn-binding protein ZnuA
MNVATAVAGMFAFIQATVSSNAAVNREPGCAQPTLATTTPWSGQVTRNIVAAR